MKKLILLLVIACVSVSCDSLFELLELKVNNDNSNSNYRTTTYDFKTKTTRESNAVVEILNQYIINSRTYNDVMEITFNDVNSNEVKTVFYAKQYGVIKFIKGNGNEFELN